MNKAKKKVEADDEEAEDQDSDLEPERLRKWRRYFAAIAGIDEESVKILCVD